jgi:YlmC/YmxH family sporulation protein
MDMQCRIEELRCKEVVNITDGCRLGAICDVEIEMLSGTVAAIVIPGPCRFFGLFGREDDYVVPWSCIKRLGTDIILVEVAMDTCRKPRKKRAFF